MQVPCVKYLAERLFWELSNGRTSCRNAAVPNADCYIQKDGFYYGGMVTGVAAHHDRKRGRWSC